MKDYSISKEARFVLSRLEEKNEEAYLVGGCVRDFLLKKEPSDFDVTTSARPEKIMEIFSDKRLVTLGKEFGTIGVLVEESLIEVTTFRSDGDYLDGRHPERVSFSDNLLEDLKRRDFTINAMAMDIEKKIIDPFKGQKDLEGKIIKCVGEPEKRFSEDKLRMLRAIRFANRLSFSIEDETFLAIKKMATEINQVSKERIREEINKILLSDSPGKGLDLLLEAGLLREIIPELIPTVGYDQKSPYHHRNLYKHITCVVDRVPKKIHLKLAGLFHDIAKVETLTIDEKGVGHFYGHDQLGAQKAEEILKRLKYDKKTIKSVRLLIEKHMKADPNMGDKGLKRMIKYLGEDLVLDLIDLMLADLHCTRDNRDDSFLLERKNRIKELIAKKPVIDKKGLAINGRDLINLGFSQGRKIGEILDYLTDLVIDNEDINSRERLLEIVKDKYSEEK